MTIAAPTAVARLTAVRRLRRLSAKLLLAATVGLVVLELGLRVLDVQVPMQRVWRWHAQLGWTQVPGAVFDYEIDGRPVHLAFNSLGFRDGEHTLGKPPGTRRIVVVGDSFCEAGQVDLAETFHQQLRARLEAKGGGAVEAINLGVGDWGQSQQLLALRDVGLAYAPDLAICQVFALNDLANNAIGLYGLGKSHNDLYRPYFVEQDGALVETRRHPWLHRLRVLSRVFLNAERIWHRVSWELEGSGVEQKWAARSRTAGFPGMPPLLHVYVSEQDQPEPIRRAWRITERLLEEMAALCRARGVPFVIAVIAWNGTIGDEWPRVQAQYPTLAMDADLPDRRLERLGERLGVPVLTTRALLERSGDVFAEDGHLNAAGHRVVADALFELLERRGLLAK
ncbi:MAG TPA: SGNH/GDSL hydrolase family protein [Planctomycetota bacterium]